MDAAFPDGGETDRQEDLAHAAARGVALLLLLLLPGQRSEHVEVKMQRYDLVCTTNRTTNNRNASRQSKQPQDSRRSS